jgi:hypothetical protein
MGILLTRALIDAANSGARVSFCIGVCIPFSPLRISREKVGKNHTIGGLQAPTINFGSTLPDGWKTIACGTRIDRLS